MATSGGGFAASGLLQGFAQAYNSAYQRRTQQDLEQRHQLASFLISAMPNMRPEAQQDASQRLLSIYSTPIGKKLDKKLADFSTLGAGAVQGPQQAMQGPAQAGQQAAATGVQQGMQAPQPEGAPSAAGGIPQQAPSIPAPPAYSPLLSPQEHNQMQQQQLAGATLAQETAKHQAYTTAYGQLYDKFISQGLPPQQAAVEARLNMGGNVPMGIMAPNLKPQDFTTPEGKGVKLLLNPKTGDFIDPTTKQPVDIKSLGIGKPPTARQISDPLWQITKQTHPDMDVDSPEFAKEWESLRMKEKTDPGVKRMVALVTMRAQLTPFETTVPGTNTPVTISNYEALKTGAPKVSLTTQGKFSGQWALYNDAYGILGNIKQLADKVNLDDPGVSSHIAAGYAALKDPAGTPGMTREVLSNILLHQPINNSLNPDERELIISMAQGKAAATGLRSIMGQNGVSQWQQGLDSALMPGPQGAASKESLKQQVDMMGSMLDRFSPGLPAFGLNAPGATTAISNKNKTAKIPPPPSTPVQAGPKVGAVEGGYRFKGGDPGKKENWEPVK